MGDVLRGIAGIDISSGLESPEGDVAPRDPAKLRAGWVPTSFRLADCEVSRMCSECESVRDAPSLGESGRSDVGCGRFKPAVNVDPSAPASASTAISKRSTVTAIAA